MNNSIWINGLRTFTWIFFFAIIIAGIIIGIGAAGFLGFIIGAVISFLVAFLTVAAFMVMLEQAEDIRAIRETLCGTINSSGVYTPSSFSSGLSAAAQEKKEEEILNNGGWKCSKCSKINPQYTGTCSCGNTKYHN